MRPTIVAELGLNHNGDLGLAKTMIVAAKELGADYVKFQKRTIEACYTDAYLSQPRISKWGKTVRDEKRGLEFGTAEYDEIDGFCKQQGIKWFASPWDVESLAFLVRYEPEYIKIASACINNDALQDAAMLTGIPWILSTGMASLGQLLNIFDAYAENPVHYLLHCVATYPTPHEEMNLGALETLRQAFGDRCKIGFSNHSKELIYTVAAYLLGAEMLEFHFSLDRAAGGPDHYSSMGLTGFKRIMDHIANLEQGQGSGVIAPTAGSLEKGSHYRWRQ